MKLSYHVEFRLILRWSGFHVFRDVGCRMTHGKVKEMPHGTSKGVTLGIKEMAHIEPHGWHDPMAHNDPLECMMS